MSVRRLAPHPICRDFEADVLARLARRRASLHGCPVEAVACKLDGSIVIWFAGPRDGVAWRGALRFSLPWLGQHRLLADPVAVTETALALLARISAGAAAPLAQRTSAGNVEAIAPGERQ
jgi:hypothetical protein